MQYFLDFIKTILFGNKPAKIKPKFTQIFTERCLLLLILLFQAILQRNLIQINQFLLIRAEYSNATPQRDTVLSQY